MKCRNCKGTGYIRKVDELWNTYTDVLCGDCNGTGVVDSVLSTSFKPFLKHLGYHEHSYIAGRWVTDHPALKLHHYIDIQYVQDMLDLVRRLSNVHGLPESVFVGIYKNLEDAK